MLSFGKKTQRGQVSRLAHGKEYMDLATLSASVNVVWIVLCAIIVFFMQAGFAMLESGFVRSKNAVNVIMKNYMDMSLGSIGFFLVGFGLMFGVNRTGLFGSSLFAPSGASPEMYAFIFFQMMFAATAATIMSGALAERIRYWPYIVAAVVISSFIYPVFGSWAWGSVDGATVGWLKGLGYLDFAGSSVVHAVGGWSALAGILVLGPRAGRFGKRGGQSHAIPGHNLPMAALGAFILWFGFFAFNAGSTLSVDANLGLIVLNTHLAGAFGVLGSVLVLFLRRRPLLLQYPVNGGLAGLVAICAGADVMTPLFAGVTGLVAGVVVVFGADLLERLRLDDAVGAVPVHAFAGTWGVLAVGFLSADHFLDPAQLGIQALGAAAVFLWAFPTSWLMFKFISALMNLRVSTAEERRGLDYSEHHELGYPEFQGELLHGGREEAAYTKTLADVIPTTTIKASTATPADVTA